MGTVSKMPGIRLERVAQPVAAAQLEARVGEVRRALPPRVSERALTVDPVLAYVSAAA